ncbi:carbon starvation induced protein CsiD [Escherichia coli]
MSITGESYLRQPHRVMELHNDGTYIGGDHRLCADDENRQEQNMQGEISCCCI